VEAAERVVIGDRERRDAGRGGLGDGLGRRQRAVRGRRVNVQVDQRRGQEE
jgi:hypothetical protein